MSDCINKSNSKKTKKKITKDKFYFKLNIFTYCDLDLIAAIEYIFQMQFYFYLFVR
jgi:hypothetical protein